MTDSMIAARMHHLGGKLTIDRVPIPTVAVDDGLVKVGASGICHSDINHRDGVAPVGRLPITLGHEIAGTLAKTGRRIKDLQEGGQSSGALHSKLWKMRILSD
jgi:propanol-preferring alcohol dehydrogenase